MGRSALLLVAVLMAFVAQHGMQAAGSREVQRRPAPSYMYQLYTFSVGVSTSPQPSRLVYICAMQIMPVQDQAADLDVHQLPSVLQLAEPQALSAAYYQGDGHRDRPYDNHMFWDKLTASYGECGVPVGTPCYTPCTLLVALYIASMQASTSRLFNVSGHSVQHEQWLLAMLPRHAWQVLQAPAATRERLGHKALRCDTRMNHIRRVVCDTAWPIASGRLRTAGLPTPWHASDHHPGGHRRVV